MIQPMRIVPLFCLLILFGAGSVDAGEKKLNVLFIAADDMNTDLGCYGHPQVKTPHLDRLAARGVLFDKAYCQQPLCGPSRASLMTGLRPDTLNMHTLRHELRKKNPDVVTLGQLFRRHGYYSARAGKIYHYGNPTQIGTNGNDDPQTWDERFNPAGIDKTREENIIRYGRRNKTGRKGGLGISMAWWDPVSEDAEHTDGMVAEKIIERIDAKAKSGEPFFLAAGFFNPHCPYVAPKRYFDLYDIDDITVPNLDEAKADLSDVPPMAIQRDTRGWPYYFKGVTPDEARQCKLAYYATISYTDALVGKLIAALERNNLIDNTLIVFWSDHGYFLGEKGLWYKRKAFERAARSPLIIAGPGVEPGVCDQPVELLDLYPTLADYCQLDAPNNLEGASLRRFLEDPSATWDKPAITQVWHNHGAFGYSIRTARWRYTEWKRGEAGVELYDHANDPGEVNNLAEDPKHASTVKQLAVKLKPYVNPPKK